MSMNIRNCLPKSVKNILWGAREKWGREIDHNDQDWLNWQKLSHKFYIAKQQTGVGSRVNDAGYTVMSGQDLAQKTVLEVGAGDMRHQKYWTSRPSKYVLIDVNQDFLRSAEDKLTKLDINYESYCIDLKEKIPVKSNSIDVVVSFYSLKEF